MLAVPACQTGGPAYAVLVAVLVGMAVPVAAAVDVAVDVAVAVSVGLYATAAPANSDSLDAYIV